MDILHLILGGCVVFVATYMLSKELFCLNKILSNGATKCTKSKKSKSFIKSTIKPFVESFIHIFTPSTLKSVIKKLRKKTSIKSIKNITKHFFVNPANSARFYFSILAGVMFVCLCILAVDFDVFDLIKHSFFRFFATNNYALPNEFLSEFFDFSNMFISNINNANNALDFPLQIGIFAESIAFKGVFYVWICVLFGLGFVICAFDFRYLCVLDRHNVAFFILCACKAFFISFVFYAIALSLDLSFDETFSTLWVYIFIQVITEIAKDMLLGAGLLSLVLLFGKIFYKEILGEGDIIFCAGFSGLFGFNFLVMSIFWGCL